MGADGGREARTDERRWAPWAHRLRAMARTMEERLRGEWSNEDRARYARRLAALGEAFDADAARWLEEDRAAEASAVRVEVERLRAAAGELT